MDADHDVIWVAHPALRHLSQQEEFLIYNYFQSVERSGGGEVVSRERIADGRGDTTALLIKFSDAECVRRVCAREHNLGAVFHSQADDKFASVNQKMEVKPHSSSGEPATVHSPASPDDWTILSECSGSSASQDSSRPTTKIEVYEFPSECEGAELTSHFFSEPYNAHCLTSDDDAFNPDTRTFILEFYADDAEKILSNPEQNLYNEEGERLRLRLYAPVQPIRQLLVQSKTKVPLRLAKNHFKKLGDMEKLDALGDDGLNFLVTYTNAEDAERLANQRVSALNPTLSVTMQLHKDTDQSEPLANPHLSRSDSPMSIDSPRETTRSPVLHVDSKPKVALPGRVTAVHATPSTSYVSSSAFKPTPRAPRRVVNQSPPVVTSPTHVEIDKLSTTSVDDMHSLLGLHMVELFGEGVNVTKFKHSYDKSKNVFRFDLKAEEIQTLLNSQQVLFPEDGNSALTIRPLGTGCFVVIRVIHNPANSRFTRDNLQQCFGEQSAFASSLTIVRFQQTKADLKMETCSVASLVVSIHQYLLNNKIVLEASFPSAEEQAALIDLTTVVPPKVVAVETDMSSSVLKKFIKSKSKGSLTSQLDDGRYLVEYETHEAAKNVVEKEYLEYMGRKMKVSFYTINEDMDDGDEEALPTLIEVKMHPKRNPRDMHMLLVLHFGEVLGHEQVLPLEQSFDKSKQLFRFDLPESDIKKLTESPQFLEEGKKDSELSITACSTGKRVVIRPKESSKKRLSKTQLKATFGPAGDFKTPVEIVRCVSDEAELEFATHSTACWVASVRQHTLKNQMVVIASLPEEEVEESTSESTEEEDDVTEPAGPSRQTRGKAGGLDADEPDVMHGSRAGPTPQPRSGKIVGSQVLKTYLVTNLLDVDEQTVYFWMKTLTGVWPRSIQLSADESQAIVKMSSECTIDGSKLVSANSQPELHLHGEQLTVTQVAPTNSIQVTCSCEQSTMVETDTLEAYFSNARYTGVANMDSLKRVKSLGPHEGLQVFVVTYSNAKDVESVLQRKPHKHGRYRFDVAEYYPDVGVCSLDSLCLYQTSSKTQGSADIRQTPVLHIKDIDENDVDPNTLELFMCNRRKCDGGEILSWEVKRVPGGLSSVEVIYKDPAVAERVYSLYHNRGLSYGKHDLHLELELPWLTKDHDDKKVRVSGLTNELDPEKLKFYLSSLSDNVVAEMFFDESQTKAVAVFQRPIDYSKIIQQSRLTTMKDLPQLKISQEFKTRCLVAVGKLTKEDIELPLESMLQNGFSREVDVVAEEFPGTTHMWKIVTDPDALEYILARKHAKDRALKRIQSISPYSEFLGLHVTSGVQKRTQELSNLVTDQLILRFLLHVPVGQAALSGFLRTLGLSLTDDGCVSIDQTSSKRSERTVLKNWRQLKPCLQKFVNEKFATYHSENLTQQVYEKTKPLVVKLLADQPIAEGDQSQTTNAGNQISFAGEKETVARLRRQISQMISRAEHEIRDEKSVTSSVIPNILEYQIAYMNHIGFFAEMIQKHKLKSFTGNVRQQQIEIQGRPASLDSVQKEMFNLLPKVSQSKVSCNKKPIFLKVFKTEPAEQTIKQEFRIKKLSAIWFLENKTISVYSDSKTVSQAAMDCINDTIWEAQYPAASDLDDMEKKLLISPLWKAKKAELVKIYQPLEIFELGDRPGLSMAGLKQVAANVLEEVPQFFDFNVKRTVLFAGSKDRIAFLEKYRNEVFRILENDHNVTIAKTGASVNITGTKDDVANCQRALTAKLNAISKTAHKIDHPTMIQYINEEPECLATVGLKTRCLVVPHTEEEEVVGRPPVPARPSRSISGGGDCRYSVTLRSGTVCEVRKDDITTMTCDGIVNAANGDLNHVGGLAYAVVRQGGSIIQQECTNYVRRNGALMEGQVYTSSAGSLKCKKVIHAVGPRWRGGYSQEELTLFTCIENCFDEADRHRLTSLAIPPISTGIFGYPLDQAVKTIVEVVNSRENQGSFLPQKIVFADNKEDSLRMFEDQLRARYDIKTPPKPKLSKRLHKPASPQNKPAAGVSSGKYVINGDTISILNRMNVEVKKGDISNSQEDVLVNSVGNQLDLSTGKVAQAIAAKAGPQLQAACSALAPINTGEVKSTQGFGLACRQVLHCNCPQYQGAQALQALNKIVIECLTQSAANGYQSIAFPALGTGNLRYPEAEVAQTMIQAVIEYTERNANSSLKDVKIVIYHLDQKTQKGFDDELQRLGGVASSSSAPGSPATPGRTGKRNLEPKAEASVLLSDFKNKTPIGNRSSAMQVNVQGSVKVNSTMVRVIQGDISEHVADVLVNSTDRQLNVQGQVSRVLLNKAGNRVREEVRQLGQTPSDHGIWVSSAGSLSANHIFHIDSSLCTRSASKWAVLLSECLSRCDEMEVTSIAFPAIGTGNLGNSAKDMAKTILQAVVGYVDGAPRTLLEHIDVVIFQPGMVKDFVDSMRRAVDKKESWWSRLRINISQWIFGGGTTSPAGEAAGSVESAGVFGGTAGPQTLQSPLMVQQGVLELDIYGESNADIRACQAELANMLGKAVYTMRWRDKPSYPDDRSYIAKLSHTQKQRLQEDAKRLNVTLNIDDKLSDIKIVGLSKEVFSMSDIIASELKKLEKKEHEKKEGELIAKAIQWQYEDDLGKWQTFALQINKALEDTYKKNPNANYTYHTDEGIVRLDLNKLSGTEPSGGSFKIQRMDLSKPQDSIALPSHWQAPLDQYSEVALVPATLEYKQVESDFMKTLGSRGNNVLQITRVQNPGQYQQYVVLRKTVAKRLNKQESLVETVPLWHGTDEDTVSKITSGRFDRGYSGKNATALGAGSYFAKNSSYSAQPTYSRPNSQGHKYIIQARVVTGEWCQGSSQMRAAPYKTQNSTDQFDSVVDNPASPSIFVVFNDASAYGEYIIKFQ